MIDGARLGDDQRRAAEHAAPVVLAQPEVRCAVDAPVALHARHDKPVPQPQAANRQRLEKRSDVIVGCRRRRLFKVGHAQSPSAASARFLLLPPIALPRAYPGALSCNRSQGTITSPREFNWHTVLPRIRSDNSFLCRELTRFLRSTATRTGCRDRRCATRGP